MTVDSKHNRAAIRWAYIPFAIVVLAMPLGCGPSKPTAQELANKKRWEEWKKNNPSDPAVLEAAYQARQKQLAEKRAKAPKATDAAAHEQSKQAPPASQPTTNPSGSKN